MRVLFIRHAEAVDATTVAGQDLARPLTDKGRRRMRKGARLLARRYARPDRILSSEAVRARQTADLVAKAFGVRSVRESALLNPGARPAALRKLLRSLGSCDLVVLVGHEPDFSAIVADLVSGGRLRMDFGKGACADVELNPRGAGVLRAFLQPDRFAS